MKNVLFAFAAPLGDTIIATSFLTSYHIQFPDHNIYYFNHWNNSLNQLIGNHSFIKQFNHFIHSCIKFDMIYELFLYEYKDYKIEIENDDMYLHHCIYEYFKLKYKIDLPIVDNIPNINIDNKSIKTYDKPVCLLNHCVSYGGFDTTSWGLTNFYNIVELLKEKIHFISIGATDVNYDGNIIKREIPNVHENLINKTNLEQLKTLIYNADFILTSESGINHLAHIEAYKPRHVFLLAGNRIMAKKIKYETLNVYDYNFYSEQNTCKEKFCHTRNIMSKINNQILGDTWCKYPVIHNNEIMSCCLSEVSVETVYKKFLEVLKTYESN